MTREEFLKLERGDIVQHLSSGISYVIEQSCSNVKIAVRTVTLTNPTEWIKIKEKR